MGWRNESDNPDYPDWQWYDDEPAIPENPGVSGEDPTVIPDIPGVSGEDPAPPAGKTGADGEWKFNPKTKEWSWENYDSATNQVGGVTQYTGIDWLDKIINGAGTAGTNFLSSTSGLAALATLAAAMSNKPETAQEAADKASKVTTANYNAARAAMDRPIVDAMGQTFRPYSQTLSVKPMDRSQIAYTGNPTGAGLPDPQGRPTQGFQTPGVIPPKPLAQGGEFKAYRQGGPENSDIGEGEDPGVVALREFDRLIGLGTSEGYTAAVDLARRWGVPDSVIATYSAPKVNLPPEKALEIISGYNPQAAVPEPTPVPVTSTPEPTPYVAPEPTPAPYVVPTPAPEVDTPIPTLAYNNAPAQPSPPPIVEDRTDAVIAPSTSAPAIVPKAPSTPLVDQSYVPDPGFNYAETDAYINNLKATMSPEAAAKVAYDRAAQLGLSDEQTALLLKHAGINVSVPDIRAYETANKYVPLTDTAAISPIVPQTPGAPILNQMYTDWSSDQRQAATDALNEYAKNGDLVGAYNRAKELGLSSMQLADAWNYGHAATPVTPDQIKSFGVSQGFDPLERTTPIVPAKPVVQTPPTGPTVPPTTETSYVPPYVPPTTPPPTPVGGSSTVNPLPVVNPLDYTRNSVPFSGDFLKYGQGPEHLFFNKVNPLYTGPGTVWNTTNAPTVSNENLSYIPPTTGPSRSTINPTNAFSTDIAHGQTAPDALAWWNYNNRPMNTGATFAHGGNVGMIPPMIAPQQGHVAGGSPGQADDVNARLSHGEYIMDADTVASLGDGNTEAGAGALDKMREEIRRHKRSAPINKIPPKAKKPMAYLRGGNK